MAGSTQTSVAYLYKHGYAGDLGDVARRRHTLLARLSKTGGFTGADFKYPAKYANPGSVSGTFARAQANANGSKGVQFTAARSVKFGVITLNGVSLRAADSKNAFASLVTTETDGVITEMQNRLAFDIYRDGTGNRGQISAINGNVITLTRPADVRNFEPQMPLVADDSANGLSPRTGTTLVDSLSISDGTITLVSAAALIGLSVNDFLFVDGDATTVGVEGSGCMEGLEVLTPLVTPVRGSDNFRGVDRGVYPERLAGSRVSNTNSSIEQNAGLVAVTIDTNGGFSKECVVNPLNFFQVATRLNAKVEFMPGGDATWGFETIKIATAAGILTMLSDPDCPVDRGRVYDPDSIYIRTLDDFVHTIMDDNNGPSMRSVNSDDIEIRIRSINNLIQSDTRNQGVFQI